tara:strand:+ start:201 stop:824 length:624 start_codon:yes stop_codon:yes gene_type:complete
MASMDLFMETQNSSMIQKQKIKNVLFLKVDSDDDNLYTMYCNAANEHNNKVNSWLTPDSGFDVYTPGEPIIVKSNTTVKVDFKIKCAMYSELTDNIYTPCGFSMDPRSSISKSQLRLANSRGIIDSGYRGNLGAYFDVIRGPALDGQSLESDIETGYSSYQTKKYQRFVQICGPALEPFVVKVLKPSDTLEMDTQRGQGGFGSTGST